MERVVTEAVYDDAEFGSAIASIGNVSPDSGKMKRFERETQAMVKLIGNEDDGFALLASPTTRGQFNVMIQPQIEGLAPQVVVSMSKLRQFLQKYYRQVRVERLSATGALFVSSVTKEKVCELTMGSRTPLTA